MNATNIELIESFQKNYQVEDEDQAFIGNKGATYTTYLRELKHSFVDKEEKIIYFLEDTGYSDAQLMIINYTLPINENNSYIKTLDGINYVSDIKFDTSSKKIYIITGLLSSEMYQFDLNFNKLRLSEGCSVDFLKFPTEWGTITNIHIDYQTGFIYAPISSRWGFFNGALKES